jgi:hypothetical protein
LGFWPDKRSDLGAGLFKPSLEGGLLEFLLFSASRPSSWAMRAINTACCAPSD